MRAVLIGSLYSLMALGLTMSYAASKYPNFAHGDLVTAGGYLAALLTSRFSWDFVSATVIAAAAGGIVGFSMFRFIFMPLMKKLQNLLMLLVATVAVSLMLRNFITLVAFPFQLMLVMHPMQIQGVAQVGGIVVTNIFVATVPTMLCLTFLLYMMLSRTKIGKAMRALSVDPALAESCGVNTDRIQSIAWALSGAMAGLAGSFLAWNTALTPTTGSAIFIEYLPASIIGGMVSFPATVVGAYIIGLAENPLMDFLNMNFGIVYDLKPAVAFCLAIAIILIRPTGLAGLPSRREILAKLHLGN
jgi:branched-subunit amino acid ABC-type transport system permease component